MNLLNLRPLFSLFRPIWPSIWAPPIRWSLPSMLRPTWLWRAARQPGRAAAAAAISLRVTAFAAVRKHTQTRMEGQPMQSNEQRELSAQSEPSYPFLSGVADIRRRARRHIQDGAVTTSYGADRDTGVAPVERGARHRAGMRGALQAPRIHRRREGRRDHPRRAAAACQRGAGARRSDRRAHRRARGCAESQSGPIGRARSHSESSEGEDLAEMLAEDLIAERIAIESYREIIQYLGNKDRDHSATVRVDPGGRRRARSGTAQPA